MSTLPSGRSLPITIATVSLTWLLKWHCSPYLRRLPKLAEGCKKSLCISKTERPFKHKRTAQHLAALRFVATREFSCVDWRQLMLLQCKWFGSWCFLSVRLSSQSRMVFKSQSPSNRHHFTEHLDSLILWPGSSYPATRNVVRSLYFDEGFNIIAHKMTDRLVSPLTQ